MRTGAGVGVARAAAAGVRARARDGGRAGWLVELGGVGRRACMALCTSLCVSVVTDLRVCVPVCLCACLCVSSVAFAPQLSPSVTLALLSASMRVGWPRTGVGGGMDRERRAGVVLGRVAAEERFVVGVRGRAA